MIVFHGSHHEIDYPDYAEMAENTTRKAFPLGLWASPSADVARLYGPNVYKITLEAIPFMMGKEECLEKPRHIHIRDGRDVIILRESKKAPNSVIIVNLDSIVGFEQVEARSQIAGVA